MVIQGLNNVEKYKISSRSSYIVFFLFVLIGAFSKFLQTNVLKQFYDGQRILNDIIYNVKFTDKTYNVTEAFFAVFVKNFKIVDIKIWSWIIGSIGAIVVLAWIRRYKKEIFILDNFILFILSFSLLEIYLFNVSKEIVQIPFMLPAYAILFSAKTSEKKKWVVTMVTMLFIALFFRRYYAIMLVIFFLMWNIFFCKKQKNRLKFIIPFLILLWIGLWGAKQIAPSIYYEVVGIRAVTNASYEKAANTIIMDVFKGTGPIEFLLNWSINTLRLLFPVELFTKGIFQSITAIYLIWVDYVIVKEFVKCTRRGNSDLSMLLCLILSFVICSAIFEPDFGSYIRHETMFYPVVQMILIKLKEKN